MSKLLKNQKGFTLVEILVAMVLIGLLVMAFYPLLTTSAQTMARTKSSLDATHVGKDAMEQVYNLSTSVSYGELENETGELHDKLTDVDMEYVSLGGGVYQKELVDGKLVALQFEKMPDRDKLIRVIAKVYKDNTKAVQEIKYESLYLWQNI